MILNKPRFLAKYGMSSEASTQDAFNSGGGGAQGLKLQVVGLLSAVDYLKVPVIALNAVTILFELLLGGT